MGILRVKEPSQGSLRMRSIAKWCFSGSRASLHAPVLVQQQVLRFQVSVYHVHGMDLLDPCDDLMEKSARLAPRTRRSVFCFPPSRRGPRKTNAKDLHKSTGQGEVATALIASDQWIAHSHRMLTKPFKRTGIHSATIRPECLLRLQVDLFVF